MTDENISNQPEKLIVADVPHSHSKEKPGPKRGKFLCPKCDIRTDGLPGDGNSRECPICHAKLA